MVVSKWTVITIFKWYWDLCILPLNRCTIFSSLKHQRMSCVHTEMRGTWIWLKSQAVSLRQRLSVPSGHRIVFPSLQVVLPFPGVLGERQTCGFFPGPLGKCLAFFWGQVSKEMDKLRQEVIPPVDIVRFWARSQIYQCLLLAWSVLFLWMNCFYEQLCAKSIIRPWDANIATTGPQPQVLQWICCHTFFSPH